MKANHNYYVNSAESLADAIKAIFPPTEKKSVWPYGTLSSVSKRSQNSGGSLFVFLQSKLNQQHHSDP